MKNILTKLLSASPRLRVSASLLTVAVLLTAALVHAAAIKTGYITKTAVPVATTSTNCEIVFPQEPTSQMRLVSWEAWNDTNAGGNLTFYGGTQPVPIIGLLGGTNIQTYSNSMCGGTLTNSIAIIQRSDDTAFFVQLLGTNQSTNITMLGTNGIYSVNTNDVLWLCTNVTYVPISQPLGAAPGTNLVVRAAGECLFSVQRRAPLGLRMTNISLTLGSRVNATVKYDVLP